MWKWLRSWFAWRFSLRRLVVAVVFLGAVVGLNMREIGPQPLSSGVPSYFWGWPLPSYCSPDKRIAELEDQRIRSDSYVAFRAWNEHKAAIYSYRLPLTHQTYRLLYPDDTELLPCAIIDALFALTVLFLILFLQIPRRKVAAKGG